MKITKEEYYEHIVNQVWPNHPDVMKGGKKKKKGKKGGKKKKKWSSSLLLELLKSLDNITIMFS